MLTTIFPMIRRFMVYCPENKGKTMATITIEVPEEILEEFGKSADERSRWALEALVIQAYRKSLFTRRELAAILNMPVMVFDEFLQEQKIPNNVDVDRVTKGYNAGKLFLIPE